MIEDLISDEDEIVENEGMVEETKKIYRILNKIPPNFDKAEIHGVS